ncbi:GNAT family N-acetyltransferase [Acidimangrovimonas pyrenivorans]|uniref:GNAT family N-acetyltransferase n=1 Tax=Acidimangrovimonas pyrenivorans TaxID=2030798 RepID=A0ABV7AJ98_9RHOB
MSGPPETPDALAALHARCFTTPRPWSADEFASLLSLPGCFLLTGTGGFLLGRAIAGEAELLTLAVAPETRRRGLGRTLLARFEAEAAARGAENAFLEVAADNAPARALYETAGWRQTGRRKNYYRGAARAVDALLYAKAMDR